MSEIGLYLLEKNEQVYPFCAMFLRCLSTVTCASLEQRKPLTKVSCVGSLAAVRARFSKERDVREKSSSLHRKRCLNCHAHLEFASCRVVASRMTNSYHPHSHCDNSTQEKTGLSKTGEYVDLYTCASRGRRRPPGIAFGGGPPSWLASIGG